jgi:5-formyltetrahydrofolate cyclo-ligase
MMARRFMLRKARDRLTLADAKREMRGRQIAVRDALHDAIGADANAALAARGLPVEGRIVSGFHPFGSEISTLPLLGILARKDCVTALPVVQGKGLPLLFRKWAPSEELVSGIWQIPIPPETADEVEPDVLLVPMLAYDLRGYRLGYGGGFYDRTLALLRAKKPVTAIGVAYHGQAVEDVPHDDLDQRVDYIMTERETFRCG